MVVDLAKEQKVTKILCMRLVISYQAWLGLGGEEFMDEDNRRFFCVNAFLESVRCK